MARVWAAATAARDGAATPAPLEHAREPIVAAMAEPGAFAVVAVEGDVVALAIAMPAASGNAREAEVRFLGVAPGRWRDGLGTSVMTALVERLRRRGYDSAGLLVYVDNLAAIRLYERCGWRAVDAPATVHPRSGRLERRYRVELRPAATQEPPASQARA
jgi:ribosomal protein S18 acetylase RimI-like enzyme